MINQNSCNKPHKVVAILCIKIIILFLDHVSIHKRLFAWFESFLNQISSTARSKFPRKMSPDIITRYYAGRPCAGLLRVRLVRQSEYASKGSTIIATWCSCSAMQTVPALSRTLLSRPFLATAFRGCQVAGWMVRRMKKKSKQLLLAQFLVEIGRKSPKTVFRICYSWCCHKPLHIYLQFWESFGP